MKRIISLLLAFAMVLPNFTMFAGAEEPQILEAPVVIGEEPETLEEIVIPEAVITVPAEETWETEEDNHGVVPADITENSSSSLSFTTFEDLKELAARSYSERTYISYLGTGDLIISENLSLPMNTQLVCPNEGIALVVPEGVVFEADELSLEQFEIHGSVRAKNAMVRESIDVTGSLTTEYLSIFYATYTGIENVTGYIQFQLMAESIADLKAIASDAEKYASTYYWYADFAGGTIDESLELPGNYNLMLREDVSINADCTVVANGRVQIDEKLTLEGSLVNNGELWIMGAMELREGGTLSGNGCLRIEKDTYSAYEDAVIGLDWTQYGEDLNNSTDYYWILRSGANLTKLLPPEELAWGREYSDGEYVWDENLQEDVYVPGEKPGVISWRSSERAGEYILISIYQVGENAPVFQTKWMIWPEQPGAGLSVDVFNEKELESGIYYFTLQYIGDYVTYANSDIAVSEQWEYTKPLDRLAACTDLVWNWPEVQYTPPEDTEYIESYGVNIYYQETADSELSEFDMSTGYGENGIYTVSLAGRTLQEGYYSFKVRPLTSDMTKALIGEWSNLSPAYYFSGGFVPYPTEPEETQPPETEPPVTEPVETEPPETEPPVTEPPAPAVPEVTISYDAATGKPKISWKAVEGAVKYQVLRSKTGKAGSFGVINTVTTLSTVNKNAVTGTTYYYKVRAVAADGSMSELSQAQSAVCKLPAPVLKSYSLADSGKIKLYWDAVEGASKYEIWRSKTGKTGSYGKIKTVTGTSFINTGAEAGVKYYYKIKAVHATAAATSEFSNSLWRTCDLAQPTITLTVDNATGKVKISWKAIEGAAKYEVWRSTSKDSGYTRLITTTATSQLNKNGVAGTTYYYKVRALHSVTDANSAYSPVKSALCKLAQPVVTATNVIKTGKPYLKWDAVEGASKYEVYYKRGNAANFTLLFTTTNTFLNNLIAVQSVTYSYKVRAIHENEKANSVFSPVVTKTCMLKQPTVKAGNVAASGYTKLTWSKVDYATEYHIYRSKTENGSYGYIGKVTGTSCTDKGSTVGTTYYYKVKAVNGNTGVGSAFSAIVSKSARLAQPVISFKAQDKTGKPRLSWTKIAHASTYEIQRATKKAGPYTSLDVIKGTLFVDQTAKAGTTYYYRVRALYGWTGAEQTSEFSVVKEKLCALAAPTVKLTYNLLGYAKLSWNKVEGADSYRIYVSKGKNGEKEPIETRAIAKSWTDTIKNPSWYDRYYVVAQHDNPEANSVYSDAVIRK